MSDYKHLTEIYGIKTDSICDLKSEKEKPLKLYDGSDDKCYRKTKKSFLKVKK